MLDLALIRAEPARVKAAMARRGVGPEAVDAVTELDGRWTARREVREALRIRRRQISDEVARRKATLRTGPDWDADTFHAPDLVEAGREVAQELHAVETEMADLAARRDTALSALPNLPATDVPDEAPTSEPALEPALEPAIAPAIAPALEPAAGAAGHPQPPGTPPWPKDFPPLAHRDLVAMLRLAETSVSAGRGFLVWRGPGARLVRGLVRFMLDVHTREGGYEEVLTPSVATRAALVGSAHLPLLEEKMYRVEGHHANHGTGPSLTVGASHDVFLAPRGEPHLANLYAGKTLAGDRLPERLVAAGSAFRRTVGGHGGGKGGLLRLHEFPTVEVYVVCRPDQGDGELAHAVESAETILARLDLPFRRSLRPAPRLSHAAARTVDLEVWAPGTGRWFEVAAISNFTDYQARRTGTRYRDSGGRPRLVHTVGGAAVAVPRLVAALLENGQQADGTVCVPEALVPYVETDVLRAPE
ncbi:MAG TPA: aminoacyl--tRNA ligase-related protein [Phycisphaerae bacterium]|nr:aminoacyl--tRNA ligase-related protein [Phycisphaerae bacterium]